MQLPRPLHSLRWCTHLVRRNLPVVNHLPPTRNWHKFVYRTEQNKERKREIEILEANVLDANFGNLGHTGVGGGGGGLFAAPKRLENRSVGTSYSKKTILSIAKRGSSWMPVAVRFPKKIRRDVKATTPVKWQSSFTQKRNPPPSSKRANDTNSHV